MAVIAYCFCPPDKSYDLDEVLQYVRTRVETLEGDCEIDEVYADGWDDIPNGIEDLLIDIEKSHYTDVILYSLEGLTPEQLKTLLTHAQVSCAMTPWIVHGASGQGLLTTMAASEYYRTLRSLNIRMGIRHSSKQQGNAPFGYTRDGGGQLVPDENHGTLQKILNLNKSNVSVMEISRALGMSPSKIYGILRTWRDKNE